MGPSEGTSGRLWRCYGPRMGVDFGSLLHRFGPQVQERQLHIAASCPDIATGGWDIDFGAGAVKFRQSGRPVPVQVIGSEAQGTWMWGHALQGLPPQLSGAVASLVEFGNRHGIEALQADGFRLPQWQPGQLLSGMSCAVIAAGLIDAPGIFCCHDRANDRRLWVALMDDTLREPPEDRPLVRIVVRFPQIWAMSTRHPHEGGITLVDWVLALDGYCRSYGVDGSMDGQAVVLRHGASEARFTEANGELQVEAKL
jgi:hypothetical protein